jgi:hypothetical protein
MNLSARRVIIFGVILTVVVFLPGLGLSAQAQGPCTEFRGIAQEILPTPVPLKPDDTWGGYVYASLGGSELLLGIVSGNDGNTRGQGVAGMGDNGSYTFVFGGGVDSFKVEIPHAVWPFPPGKIGVGYYRGNGKILQGTGRFYNASGVLDWSGPAVVWPDANSPFGIYGRFNAEVRGSICGVQ